MHPWKIPSPFQPPPPPSGFSVVITMFGSGATYNADGTVTGTPNGAIYTYNPAAPDAHTTAINRGNFVSPFAGFTQSSIECIRDDTPVLRGSLRVIFRQDVSPNPNRIEIVIECGTPTTNGSAANLGPFSLQILNNGVPQNIPAYTVSGAGNTWVPRGSSFTGVTNVTTAYFPEMGWFTRWRWNPTPRAEVRTVTQLLPSDLNLVPNFSPSLATQFNCVDTGLANGPNPINQYSSAWTSVSGFSVNNLNPIGVNENCSLQTSLGGVGDRPELGVATEWQANYIIDDNAAAKAATYTLAEVAGGMPWIVRDLTTGAPLNMLTTYRNYGIHGGGDVNIDVPNVPIPSGEGSSTNWVMSDVNHIPAFSAIPYFLTGDTFYLENMQFAGNWLLLANTFHRESGFLLNYADPFNSPTTPTGYPNTLPIFPSYRTQTRGEGWAFRDFTNLFNASVASPPTWLLPQSYAQSCLTDNQVYADNNSGSPNGSGTDNTFVVTNYPELTTFGSCPGAYDFDSGFFVTYGLMGLAMTVNQGGKSTVLPYLQYFAKLPVGWANGTSGWPQNWPSPYSFNMQSLSTDYDGNPSRIGTFTDMWNAYSLKFCFSQWEYWGNAGPPSYTSNFPVWAPSTAYHCNSWLLEHRCGFPIGPNVGDILSITITGSFSGSPVTVTHTVTSGDVAFFSSNITFNSATASPVPTPILDDIISKINTSAAGTAGITAAYSQTGGVGVSFTTQRTGRMYLGFNSATVGNITVTGSYAQNGPLTAASIYIQSNGDGVRNGNAGTNLFGRSLNYVAAATGTSAASGGPTGQVLQTPTAADGTVRWYYTPEAKTIPCIVPSQAIPAPPVLAQAWAELGGGSPQPSYAYWMMAAMAMAQTAGVTGASGARANIVATMNDWITNQQPSYKGRFSFSIAP